MVPLVGCEDLGPKLVLFPTKSYKDSHLPTSYPLTKVSSIPCCTSIPSNRFSSLLPLLLYILSSRCALPKSLRDCRGGHELCRQSLWHLALGTWPLIHKGQVLRANGLCHSSTAEKSSQLNGLFPIVRANTAGQPWEQGWSRTRGCSEGLIMVPFQMIFSKYMPNIHLEERLRAVCGKESGKTAGSVLTHYCP